MITGMNTTYALDKQLGHLAEDVVLPKLQSFFNASIRKMPQRYECFDYIDDAGTKYELKTRRNCMNAYPTTLIPKHKVISGEQYFVFNFIDKVSYIKYDKDLFETFETKELVDGRYGYQREGVLHYLIPIGKLTPL
jgi:hypothetical protein